MTQTLPVPAVPADLVASRGESILPPYCDHTIELALAIELTAGFRRNFPTERKAGGFFRAALDVILAQPGCLAVRIYNGASEENAHHLILVGVGADGHDMALGALMEAEFPCPPFCDVASPLFSNDTSKHLKQHRSLPSTYSHSIELEKAIRLIRNHRLEHPSRPRAGLFHRSSIDRLLAQPDCGGMRIYRGFDEAERHHFVLVAVNSVGKDLTDGVVLEAEWPCPPFCSTHSPLLG